MYKCPICGKSSNRRGDPFETEQQVVAHVDGSHDDDHDGVAGSEVRDRIEAVDTADADGQESQEDVSPSPDEQSVTAPAESGRGTGSSNLRTTAEGSETNEADTVEMTQDEINTMLDTAADEAYDAGYSDGQQQTEPVEVESTAADAEQSDESGCPNCGGPTGLHKPGEKLVTADGRTLTTDHGDAYCEKCHLIIGDGETHRLAKNPNPKAHEGGSTLGKIAAVAIAGLAVLGLAAAQQNNRQGQGSSGAHEVWDDI